MNPNRPSLIEIFVRFLKLGAIGFGGPIAMLGYLEREFVSRSTESVPPPSSSERNRCSRWLTPEQFQKFVAVSKLFPGPMATLVSVRMGFEMGGVRGGLLAGLGQILPAFFLMLALAMGTESLTLEGPLQVIMGGLGLAALAISFQATYRLTRPLYTQKTSSLSWPAITALIAINASLTFAVPQYEAAFIVLTGLLTAGALRWSRGRPREVASLGITLTIFATCFQASLFTFGSGIAIVPVLKTAFIDHHQWLTAEHFLTGLIFAQITPGPLVILSTYLGYVVGGIGGAIASTVGTFLPTIVFGNWLLPKLETKMMNSPALKTFFDGLLPAVCGAILGAMFSLTRISVTHHNDLQLSSLSIVVTLTVLAMWKNLSVWSLFFLGVLGSFLLK